MSHLQDKRPSCTGCIYACGGQNNLYVINCVCVRLDLDACVWSSVNADVFLCFGTILYCHNHGILSEEIVLQNDTNQ